MKKLFLELQPYMLSQIPYVDSVKQRNKLRHLTRDSVNVIPIKFMNYSI